MSELIKFKSTRFGDVEVPAESVIEICGGLIGFPNFTRFVILEYTEPFSWLHSVDNQDLAFVVVNAAEFGEHYSFPLPYGDRDIQLEENDEVAILSLVSVRPDPTLTTVNLKAPVVVNTKNRRGRQVVLDDARYPTRFPLWAQDEAEGTQEK